jgi:two-component system response regulator YesN
MYKVLLVDDEVLILSGIKYLIDWKAIDCKLIATANNGQQALDLINELHPDIVISDINMPILNGLELLEKCTKTNSLATFIMLTCLEEFSLIKEAIKYNAVEYLLKSDLTKKILTDSIERAKAECNIRRSYISIDIEESNTKEKDEKIIKNILSRLNLPQKIEKKQIDYLCSKDILSNYFLIQINLEYCLFNQESDFLKEDLDRIYEYQGELNLRLAKNYFTNIFQVDFPSKAHSAFLYFVYNVSNAKYETNINAFSRKISSVSQDITGVKSSVLITKIYDNEKQIEICKDDLKQLRNNFFNLGKDLIGTQTKLEFKQIVFNAYVDRISSSLKTKNINDFRYYMNKINLKLLEYNYIRGEAVVFLDELISNSLFYLTSELPANIDYPFHQDLLPYISTKSSFLEFFNNFKKQVEDLLIPYVKEKDSYVEKAKKYINENINERISLESIASEIGVSAGYLSGIFSKQCEISLFEYINKKKVERAQKMIKEKPYKIYEISTELGFDNSYYFSRIFKKQTGKTLSAYISSIKYE